MLCCTLALGPPVPMPCCSWAVWQVFWKLDTVETSLRMRRRLRRDYAGSRHAEAAADYRTPQELAEMAQVKADEEAAREALRARERVAERQMAGHGEEAPSEAQGRCASGSFSDAREAAASASLGPVLDSQDAAHVHETPALPLEASEAGARVHETPALRLLAGKAGALPEPVMDPSSGQAQPQSEAEDPLQAHHSHDDPGAPQPAHGDALPEHPGEQAGGTSRGHEGGRVSPEAMPGAPPEPSATSGEGPSALPGEAVAVAGRGPSLLAEDAVAAIAAEAGLPAHAYHQDLQVSMAATMILPLSATQGRLKVRTPHCSPLHTACCWHPSLAHSPPVLLTCCSPLHSLFLTPPPGALSSCSAHVLILWPALLRPLVLQPSGLPCSRASRSRTPSSSSYQTRSRPSGKANNSREQPDLGLKRGGRRSRAS